MIIVAPPNLQKNIPLASYTTFHIGGPAKYFFVAKNKKGLMSAISWAKRQRLPFFILGGGSNILVSDDGFSGLVIKLEIKSCRLEGDRVRVGASVAISELLEKTASSGLSGLEWAAGIPGTVGGAIFGNAGAYGCSICQSVKSVEVLTAEDNLRIKKFNNKECRFSYRHSVFKERPDINIILSVVFSFRKKKPAQIRNKIRQALTGRDQKIPSQFSAGCVFKNIIVADWPQLKERIPVDKIQDGKAAAGYLIEQCGLKGKKVGQAQISEKHANFIVNLGQAKARDVEALIEIAKQEVQKKFGVKLKEEIIFLSNL